MDNDVFRAILALDSYNRGYHPGIEGLSSAVGTNIGMATIIGDDGQQAAQDIGFYAIAYEWNGETIISYRGTDQQPHTLPPVARHSRN